MVLGNHLRVSSSISKHLQASPTIFYHYLIAHSLNRNGDPNARRAEDEVLPRTQLSQHHPDDTQDDRRDWPIETNQP